MAATVSSIKLPTTNAVATPSATCRRRKIAPGQHGKGQHQRQHRDHVDHHRHHAANVQRHVDQLDTQPQATEDHNAIITIVTR